MRQEEYRDIAKDVFRIEAKAIENLTGALTDDFECAISKIINTAGRVIICGMGKSGIVGKKIAATLASTGTPSFFMHPGEAYHGDLGMVTSQDVFVAISYSGETDEVVKLIPFLKDNGNFLVSITGNEKSTLAKAADSHLNVFVKEEACPLQLAPTASTTATLAMGDALAVTLMHARDFKPENFARFHPGGSLGKRLLSRVEDEMYKDNLPFIKSGTPVADVIHAMSSGRLGLAIVEDADKLAVVTDGDIRRAIESFSHELFSKKALDLMSIDPVSVAIGTRVEDALQLMETKKITSLLVTREGRVVGVLKK